MREPIKHFGVFLLTTVLVFCGAFFGREIVTSERPKPPEFVARLAGFDALHYRNIATGGYRYDPARPSEVAFFPAFPTAGWFLHRVTGMDPLLSLLAISNAFLAGSFFALGAYVKGRTSPSARPCVYTTLLIFGLLPPTFFFRMAYSESTFLFFCLLSVCAMQQKSPLPLVAVVVGLTTACRPVGVALLMPFLLHLWRSSEGASDFVMRCITLLPLACWGILAFMFFQYATFGDSFAFVKTQQYWAFRTPTFGIDKWLALLSWEPIWLTYDPTCAECFWKNWPPPCPLFNWQFMNPIYFVGAAILVGVGVWRRWLSSAELLLSVGLLALPYVTKAYEYGMNGHGRHAAAVFPIYLVAGRLLAELPRPVAAGILVVSGFFMAAYASMFAAGYPFF